MPADVKSKAQQRFLFAAEARGEIPAGVARRAAAKGKAYDKLPERINKTASLLHGSPTAVPTLDPGKDGVFASPYREMALAYLGRWDDDDLEQRFITRPGKPAKFVLTEKRPGALKEIFSGRSGHLHHVSDEGFAQHGPADNEMVAHRPVPVLKSEEIPDAYRALQEAGVVMKEAGAKERWEGAQKGTGGALSTAGLLGGAAIGAGLAARDLKRGKILDAGKKFTTAAGTGWTLGSLGGAARGAAQAKTSAAYKLQGRTEFQGMPISIENKKGSVRRWFDPHGNEKGSTKMHWAYGYIRGTRGTDGDHVDVYIGPNPDATHAFVVDQMKKPEGAIKKDGKPWKEFDEQKCMLGWDSAEEAKAAYLKQYDDPRFFGSLRAIPMSEFKEKVMAKQNHGKKVAELRLRLARAKIAFVQDPMAVVGNAAIGGLVGNAAGRLTGKVLGKYPGQSRDYGTRGGAIAGAISGAATGGDMKAVRVFKDVAQAASSPRGARASEVTRALGRAGVTYAPEMIGGALSAAMFARGAERKTEAKMLTQGQRRKANKVVGAKVAERIEEAKAKNAGLLRQIGRHAQKFHGVSPATRKATEAGRSMGMPVHGSASVLDQLSRTSFDKLSVDERFLMEMEMLGVDTNKIAHDMLVADFADIGIEMAKLAMTPNRMRELISQGASKRGYSLSPEEHKAIATKSIKYFKAMKADPSGAEAKKMRKELRGLVKRFKKPQRQQATGRARPGGYSAHDKPPRGKPSTPYNPGAEKELRFGIAATGVNAGGVAASMAGKKKRQDMQSAAEKDRRAAYRENRKAKEMPKAAAKKVPAARKPIREHEPTKPDAATALSTAGPALSWGATGAYLAPMMHGAPRTRRNTLAGGLAGAGLGGLVGFVGDRHSRKRLAKARETTKQLKADTEKAKAAADTASGTLSESDRDRIKAKNFAIPKQDKYPIHDADHARNALTRVAQHGTPEEQKRVRAAVAKKWPGIEQESEKESYLIRTDMLDNPEDPLHTPPTERKRAKKAGGDMIAYFQEHPEKLKAKQAREKRAALEKLAAELYEDFEYMTEDEKIAALTQLVRSVAKSPVAKKVERAIVGGGRRAEGLARGLAGGAKATKATAKAAPAAGAAAGGGLLSGKNIAKAGILGTMGLGLYAGKKTVDAGTALASGQHGDWYVPPVQGRGRVF